MPQDRASGAAAAAFGLEMGLALAKLLGASPLRAGSNEVRWNDQRAVIKSCRLANTSFGITTAMLARLDVALVAIEDRAGAYDVYEFPVSRFRAGMRDSMSGRADGKVKLLARSEVQRHGRPVARYSAAEIEASKSARELIR
jgi:hypothetical protein